MRSAAGHPRGLVGSGTGTVDTGGEGKVGMAQDGGEVDVAGDIYRYQCYGVLIGESLWPRYRREQPMECLESSRAY